MKLRLTFLSVVFVLGATVFLGLSTDPSHAFTAGCKKPKRTGLARDMSYTSVIWAKYTVVKKPYNVYVTYYGCSNKKRKLFTIWDERKHKSLLVQSMVLSGDKVTYLVKDHPGECAPQRVREAILDLSTGKETVTRDESAELPECTQTPAG